MTEALPRNWWKDDFFREHVYYQIRILIRGGFNNAEISVRVGCGPERVGKIRRKMELGMELAS